MFAVFVVALFAEMYGFPLTTGSPDARPAQLGTG